MALVVGPVGITHLGFSGNTAIECGRLLDSAVLRTAVTDHQPSDIVALISDHLHSYVIGEGRSGVDRSEFRQCEVQAKEYVRPAWLWVSGRQSGGRATGERDLDFDLARLRVTTAVDHERLFGVDDERERLATYLSNQSGDWVISIWGAPGVGKTALGYDLLLRHAKTAGFHRVAAVSAKFSQLTMGSRPALQQARLVTDWRELLVDLARQLDLPVDPVPASIEEQLPAAMPVEPCLIMIDNLETVPQAQLAIDFLARGDVVGPHKVVVTTRTSMAAGAARGIRERHWTGPDRPHALDYARYLASDDPTLDPSPGDLDDVVDAAERTPLLIRLIVQQAIFLRLPIAEVIARLRQRVGDLGRPVWDFLYADSLNALADSVGVDIAERLMSVFCVKPSGSAFSTDELRLLSEITDPVEFDQAIAAACRLTLVRSLSGNTMFTVHSLLREFSCGDLDQYTE
jgi:hypothetical protein